MLSILSGYPGNGTVAVMTGIFLRYEVALISIIHVVIAMQSS